MTLLTRTGMLAIHSLCMVPLLNILLSQVSWSFRTSYPTCTTISQLLFHYLAGPSNDIQPISLAHKFATLTLFFSGAFIFFFFSFKYHHYFYLRACLTIDPFQYTQFVALLFNCSFDYCNKFPFQYLL